MSIETLAKFFNECAHGEADHRLWLLEKFESFWEVKIPRDLVEYGLTEKQKYDHFSV